MGRTVDFTDSMQLIFKSRRYWIYYSNRHGFKTYVLTLAGRRDCWIMLENIYSNGDVLRRYRNFGFEFDFERMVWVKE